MTVTPARSGVARADTSTAHHEAATAPLAWRRELRWLPGVAVVLLLVALWREFDIPASSIAKFGTYYLLGLTLPGTLLWRAFGPQLRFRVEEYAAGTAVGYAAELGARILASMLGVPALGLAVPAVIVVVFAAVPRLRTRFRSEAGTLAVPLGAAYAIICGGLLVWLAYGLFRDNPDAFSGRSMPNGDLIFTLAFTADLLHHWPPQNGYLLGEHLYYHWFYAAHVASAHTATGIELSTLSLRLVLAPMLPLLVVGTGALAVRLSGKDWAGPFAGLLAMVVGEPLVTDFATAVTAPRYAAFGNLLGAILYMSPTLTYSMVLVVPLAVLVVDILRRVAAGPSWVLTGVLLAAVSGAKGTVLPLFMAAAGATVAGAGVLERRLHRPAAVLLGASGVSYVVTYYLVYGGESYGMKVDPFGVAAQSALASTFTGHWPSQPGQVRSIAITVLMLACFMAPWAGALLLAGRRTRRDPAVWGLAGVAALGLGTAVLLYHSGQSQLYFYRNALPILAAGAAWAVASQVPTGRRAVAVLAGALATGAAAGVLASVLFGNKVTILGRPGFTIAAMVKPFLALVAILLVLTAGYMTVRRITPSRIPAVGVLVLAACMFAGAGAVRVGGAAAYATGLSLTGHPLNTRPGAIPGPELIAARWLRDHSGADDVVMTNVHCVNGEYAPPKTCNALSFWVSAYTERRVLIEGWGYTSKNAEMGAALKTRQYPNTLPFWNPRLLARNDGFLRNPSRAEALGLRQQYGVRWIFTDADYGSTSPELDHVLIPRLAAGPVHIYEITG